MTLWTESTSTTPVRTKPRRSTFSTEARSNSPPKGQAKGYFSTTKAKTKTNYKCPKCNDLHYLNQCSAFRSLSVKDRLKFVQEQRLCVNCFQPGHRGKDCPHSWACNVEGCGLKHNRWLHLPMTSEPAASTVDNKQPAAQLFEPTTNTSNPNTRKETNVIVASTGVSQGKVALPIKPVLVKGANSVCVMAYALHDNGSSGSFCSEGLLKKLGLPAKTVTANLTTVDRKELEVKAKIVDLGLESVVDGTTYKMYQVLTRESLNISTDNMASAEELSKWNHLAGVDIPDIDASEVELLIGQDNPGLLVPLEVREGREGEPFAVRTRLGWGINGPRSEDRPNNISTHYVDLNLEKQVEKFWRLDDPSSHN